MVGRCQYCYFHERGVKHCRSMSTSTYIISIRLPFLTLLKPQSWRGWRALDDLLGLIRLATRCATEQDIYPGRQMNPLSARVMSPWLKTNGMVSSRHFVQLSYDRAAILRVSDRTTSHFNTFSTVSAIITAKVKARSNARMRTGDGRCLRARAKLMDGMPFSLEHGRTVTGRCCTTR